MYHEAPMIGGSLRNCACRFVSLLRYNLLLVRLLPVFTIVDAACAIAIVETGWTMTEEAIEPLGQSYSVLISQRRNILIQRQPRLRPSEKEKTWRAGCRSSGEQLRSLSLTVETYVLLQDSEQRIAPLLCCTGPCCYLSPSSMWGKTCPCSAFRDLSSSHHCNRLFLQCFKIHSQNPSKPILRPLLSTMNRCSEKYSVVGAYATDAKLDSAD